MNTPYGFTGGRLSAPTCDGMYLTKISRRNFILTCEKHTKSPVAFPAGS